MDLTLNIYDIFPEPYMLEKNCVTKEKMDFFANNPGTGLRDFDISSKGESEIFNVFKNDFNIHISRPILDLTKNINI